MIALSSIILILTSNSEEILEKRLSEVEMRHDVSVWATVLQKETLRLRRKRCLSKDLAIRSGQVSIVTDCVRAA